MANSSDERAAGADLGQARLTGVSRLPDRAEAPGVIWIGRPDGVSQRALDAPQSRDGAPSPRGQRIGERLVASGVLAPGDLVRALAVQAREETRLGEILLSHRMVTAESLASALADQWRAKPIELTNIVPDRRLVEAFGAEKCLAFATVPLERKGAATLVATGRPETFGKIRPELEACFGKVLMALAPEREVSEAIVRAAGTDLALRAEHKTPHWLSCRGWRADRAAGAAIALLAVLAIFGTVAPSATLVGLTAFVMMTLLATTLLKGLALGQTLRSRYAGQRVAAAGPPSEDLGPSIPTRLPTISVLVPLLQEEDIAASLISRLSRLRYPKELMDILLLVEEGDMTTRAALGATRLPGHIGVLVVPPGTVKTKPRALNYGLSFARGRIVGIWDAEDAPHPDQLHAVASHFARAEPRVACVQGALDFYNARTNWLSRCFTLEYATWFRAFLPGLQHLDLPIPLGGTTLFFRRHALEDLGGWDAHNVTEDADLGVRLYRSGYRTEIVDSVTEEEANCRLVPWIRQRSRWLKGYAMTYAVHMRSPRALWRDMGWAGFLGFQTLFAGALVHFLLSPVLLSLWLLALTGAHPVSAWLSPALGWAFLALVIASEGVSLGLTVTAMVGRRKAGLLWWVPTLQFYFPLATAAAYKGIWELVARPFYWDKTQHGLHEEEVASEAGHPASQLPSVTRAAQPSHFAHLSRNAQWQVVAGEPGRPTRNRLYARSRFRVPTRHKI